MQFLTRGLGQVILRSPKSVETGKTTVVVTQRNRLKHESFSTLPPSPNESRDNVDYDNTNGTTNFKPVNLAYRALEYRGQERENPTKSPLIIHHSLYGRKENWNPISEIINRTTMRKIINVDARNHGESPHTKEMSLPLMTKDIVHLIKQTKISPDSVDLTKFSFMGYQSGGRIGMILALTQPQLVDKLIVVDTSVLVNEKCRERWTNLRRACFVLLDIEDQLREAHGYERMNIASKAIENVIVDKKDRAHFLSSIISSGDKSNNDDSSKLWRVNLGSYISNPDMMLQVPTLDNAVFEGQTLFINGERSQYVSRDHSEAILKVFPNAEFEWIKDSGHLLHIDKPNEFCEKIITFLEK